MNFTKAGEQGLYQDWLCCFQPCFLTGKSAFCAAICLNGNKLWAAVNLYALAVLISSREHFLVVVVFKHFYRELPKIRFFIVCI